MKTVRVLLTGGLISYRALFNWLSPWIFIPSLLIAPIFQVLVFAYLGRHAGVKDDAFFLFGNAVQYAAIPCLFAMDTIIAGERYQRTLGLVLVTPASRAALVIGRGLPVILNGFLVSVITAVVGGLVLDVTVAPSQVGPMLIAVVVSAMSCTGLGLALAAVGLRVRGTAVLTNIVFGVLLLVSGADVPLETLPGWVGAVGRFVPFSHGIEAVRELAGGARLHQVAGLIGVEALVGLGYTAVGLVLLKALETSSRAHGTLEVA